MNGGKEELHGEITTLQMQLKIKLIPNTAKTNDNAPDYIVAAAGYSGADMPNRQIVFYDKKKEIIQKRKEYWFNLWDLNKEKIENKRIWRVEIRAGKKELNSWNLKRFSDFEEKAGDVLFDT